MFIKTEPSSDDHSLQSGTSTPTTCEQATTSTTEQPPNESTKKEVDTTATTTTSFTTTSDQVPMSMPLQDDLCLTAMEATIQSVFDALNVLSQQQQQQHTPQQNQSQADQQKTQSQPQQGQPSTAPSLETGLQSSNSPTTGRNGGVGHTVPYPVVTPQPVAIVPELSPAEQLKQQMMKQKIRDENRTRKQRWRVNNEERNKDNDLRCRVNKRSHKLFGMEPSEHKKKWVAEEFQRRRIKRQEKERRKQAVNGALAATNSPATPMTDESESATIAQLQHKLLQHYQSLFGMDQQDSEKTKNSTAALVAALQNPQLLQLSQLLAQTVTATTGPVPSPHSSIAPSTQATTATTSVSNNSTNDPSTFVALPHNSQSPLTPREDNENNSKGDNRMELDQSKIDLAAAEIMKQFTSHALAGTAHHLDQSALGSSSTTTPTTTSEASEISTIAATSTTLTTSGTTTPTTSVSPTAPATGSSIDTTTVAATPVESSETANMEDTIMEDAEKDDTKKDQGTEKKNDYPMDAVMTLMELNAGWRP